MNRVQPIRSRQIVRDIYDYLNEKNPRDALMYAMGIYTGLRISDILRLKVRDVKDKKYITIREKKTNKEKRIFISSFLQKTIRTYINGKKDYECLFHGKRQINIPISRQRAYKILREAADIFGINDGIGTHTLRKTFGYHYYQKTKDIAMLMELFNHSHEEVTLRYIGITQDIVDDVYKKIDLLE